MNITDTLKYHQPMWDDSNTDGVGNLSQTQGLDEQGDERCVTAIICTNIFRSQYAECVHFLIKSDEYFCLKALPKQVRVLLEILT